MPKAGRGKILFWIALCLVVAAGGVVAARAVHVGQLGKLFEGEFVDKSEHRKGYYPTIKYDLTEYTKEETDKKKEDTTSSEFHNNPEKLNQDLLKERRSDNISRIINIAFHEDTNELYINTDSGRVQRPLIVVENGKGVIGVAFPE